MIEQIVGSALEHWDELCPGEPCPEGVRYILQSRRRVILFLFCGRGKGDRLVGVVKISRRAEENRVLEKAAKSAMKVRQQLCGHVLETVPKTILLKPIQGLSVALEQGLPGKPMYLGQIPWIAGRTHRRNWQLWRAWLVEFQRQTRSRSVRIDTDMTDQILIPNLGMTLKDHQNAAHIISDLQLLVKELEGVLIPKVWRYGDAHHSNILIDKNQVSGVVDWEGVEVDHWPTSDWFQFAFQYLVDVERKKAPQVAPSEWGKRAIDILLRPSDSRLASLVHEQGQMLLAAHGIESSFGPALFVVFLAQLYWPWDKASLCSHTHAVLCR